MHTTPQYLITATITTTASTTEFPVDEINQSTTKDETATTQTVTGEEGDIPVPVSESKLQIALILSATALGIPLIHVLAALVRELVCCTRKKDAKKLKPKGDEVMKMNEFTMQINPTRTFHTYTSPIYNPYFSEENDDSYVL